MQEILFIYIIQQLLYFTSRVESLTGSKVIAAHDGEFPFIASLQSYPEERHFCTGSLITEKYVITAAHCLIGATPTQIRIVLGVVNLQTAIVRHAVALWLTYDTWVHILGIHEYLGLHDIAIIELVERVTQPNIKPVRLNELLKKQIQRKMALMTGWTGDDGNKVLQKVKVNILSDGDCRNRVRLITNTFPEIGLAELCTVATPHALSECGDSGAPLLDEHKSLVGVNHGDCPNSMYAWKNFSDVFLQQYKFNVHLSVSYYRHFIVDTTGYN